MDVIMLSDVMMSVIMLSVIMWVGVLLSVVFIEKNSIFLPQNKS